MRLALVHPQWGYYMRADPLGVQGDFTTAPEISQIFGELIGAWSADIADQLAASEIALVELGPGRGTLMADMLRATRQVEGFHASLEIRLVEISTRLQQKQRDSLRAYRNITWAESLLPLPEKPLLLVANEFFDALPIHQYRYTQDAWHEILISAGGKALSGLQFMLGESIPLPHPGKEGDVLEICPAGQEIMNQIAHHIARFGAAALIIDYGYKQGAGDSLQAVRNHRYHPVLKNPGAADITAHVDFGALERIARHTGATIHFTTQGDFLHALGARQRLEQLCTKAIQEQKGSLVLGVERLLLPAQMGDLFKVMAVTHPTIHPAGFRP